MLSDKCGVEISTNEFNGPRVKSYDAHKLADWCFPIPGMTPSLGGTVFKRIGLHVQVFMLVVYSTAVFILAPVLLTGPNLGKNPKWGAEPRGVPRNSESTFQQGEYLSANLYVNQVLDIFGMLFSLLLSRYVYMVVQVHWIEARNKRGNLMRDTQLAINLILSHHRTEEEHPEDLDKQAKLFGMKMRCLLRLGPTMTVRYLEGKRKGELGRRLVLEDEVCSWSTWKSLEPMHKHFRVTTVYRQAIRLVKAEVRENGALQGMPSETLTELLLALNRVQGSAASMLSSVNPQKLPYCYVHLIQWGSRLVFAVYIFDLSCDIAEYALHYRCALPFECFAGYGCSTFIWLGLVVCVTLLSYIVIGLLDLHGCISNLYRSNCGNVQNGLLHGIDVTTMCLVRREELALDGEVKRLGPL
jgi:hypothetical protein